jgi:hypothetical protein
VCTCGAERDDLVDEVMVVPRFGPAEGVADGDDVRRRLLDDQVSTGLEHAQNGRLPGPGSPGENVRRHRDS